MSVQSQITITHAKETIGTVQNRVLGPASKPREEASKLRNYMNALAGGDRDAKLVVQVNSGDAVAASGTITFSSFVATNTITVGTQTFTASASPSGNNQFLVTGGDTLAAAAAAAKINAHPALSPYLSATAASGVITVTCTIPGDVGNNIPLAISAHGSVSAATLASGASATTYSTQNTYHLGV